MKKIIIAVGNGGCNIVNQISQRANCQDVDFVYCNQYEKNQTLACKGPDRHINLNEVEDIDVVVESRDEDLILIVSCLGGNTGSKYAPQIANDLVEKGRTVGAFITMPMCCEGSTRIQTALAAANKLKEFCKYVICQDNAVLPETIAFTSLNDSLVELASVFLSSFDSRVCGNMAQEGKSKFTEIQKDVYDSAKIGYMGMKGRQIESPDGVKALMQSLWRTHKEGQLKTGDNVFWVIPQHHTGRVKDCDVKMGNRVSVSRMVEGVMFDDMIGYLSTSDFDKRNMIVFKDSFDFLRDQLPSYEDSGCLKFLPGEKLDSHIIVEHDIVSSPASFASLSVETDEKVNADTELLVASLLRKITSDGRHSVYEYFKPDEKSVVKVSRYIREKNRQSSWWYRLFTNSKKKAADKSALDSMIAAGPGESSDTRYLGSSLLTTFMSLSDNVVVKEIHSHIGVEIAEDYIHHLLDNYDFEDYSRYSEKIILLLSSDKERLKRLRPYLSEHFQTDLIPCVGLHYRDESITMIIMLKD